MRMTRDEVIKVIDKLYDLLEYDELINLINESRIYRKDVYLFIDLLFKFSVSLPSEDEIND